MADKRYYIILLFRDIKKVVGRNVFQRFNEEANIIELALVVLRLIGEEVWIYSGRVIYSHLVYMYLVVQYC